MDNIYWTGYSSDERHASLGAIKNIVAKYGNMVDFKLFSDISVALVIEIEETKIDSLYHELCGSIAMDAFDALNSISKKERTVYLNITFTKGSGNLIIDVPAVPG